MLGYDERVGGKRDKECEVLIRRLFENVVPRLLGVMERGGRSVRPLLLHGDLWEGDVLVFDGCCFWGHNECEFPAIPLFPFSLFYNGEAVCRRCFESLLTNISSL